MVADTDGLHILAEETMIAGGKIERECRRQWKDVDAEVLWEARADLEDIRSQLYLYAKRAEKAGAKAGKESASAVGEKA